MGVRGKTHKGRVLIGGRSNTSLQVPLERHGSMQRHASRLHVDAQPMSGVEVEGLGLRA